MIYNQIFEILLFMAKISPIIYIIIPSINYINDSKDITSLTFIKGYLVSEAINKILKYSLQMPRPYNAGNCSLIDKSSIFPKSFGMPSGHSQSAWYTSLFSSLYILNNKSYTKWKKMIYIFGITAINTFISYSRVHIHCHSTTQTIIGGIIGALIGGATYKSL